jgi:hypothetical protein
MEVLLAVFLLVAFSTMSRIVGKVLQVTTLKMLFLAVLGVALAGVGTEFGV